MYMYLHFIKASVNHQKTTTYQKSTQTIKHFRSISSTTSTKMPLVVPGLQSNSGDQTQQWFQKLAGKKIGEKHDENVCSTREVFM